MLGWTQREERFLRLIFFHMCIIYCGKTMICLLAAFLCQHCCMDSIWREKSVYSIAASKVIQREWRNAVLYFDVRVFPTSISSLQTLSFRFIHDAFMLSAFERFLQPIILLPGCLNCRKKGYRPISNKLCSARGGQVLTFNYARMARGKRQLRFQMLTGVIYM